MLSAQLLENAKSEVGYNAVPQPLLKKCQMLWEGEGFRKTGLCGVPKVGPEWVFVYVKLGRRAEHLHFYQGLGKP